ncbi:hypothetical protein AtubIFM57258_005871 [Aspergillus tubingensis]|nr:hypothetical protein AtubIFM57258_005871 [Aspergillus tubingensis]
MESPSTPFLTKEEEPKSPTEEGYSYQEHTLNSKPTPWHRQPICLTTFHVLIYLLATWGFLSLISFIILPFPSLKTTIPDVYRPETLPPDLPICDCGSTIKEALHRNCTYDSLATAWLPPHCRDAELTARFDRSGPGPNGEWSYYLDEYGTVPITNDEIAQLAETGGSFWSTREWHIAHCVFYWQKYRRMGKTGVVMEERFGSLSHVEHCSRLIMSPVPDYFFLLSVPVVLNSSDEVQQMPSRLSRPGGGDGSHNV